MEPTAVNGSGRLASLTPHAAVADELFLKSLFLLICAQSSEIFQSQSDR